MRALILAVLALLITPIVVLAAPPEGKGPGGSHVPENPIVILDPGHGGTDPGSAECAGYTEAEATLDIAEKVRVILVGAGVGYEVWLTREDNNTSFSNNDRYTFANSKNGNALVSIHLNGSTDHSVNGTQGFWGKKNKDEAFTNTVHQALVNSLGVSNRGVTNFPSGVLLKSNMPATLQETVFISNTTECQSLTDGSGNRQQQIAEAISQGVRNWFGN